MFQSHASWPSKRGCREFSGLRQPAGRANRASARRVSRFPRMRTARNANAGPSLLHPSDKDLSPWAPVARDDNRLRGCFSGVHAVQCSSVVGGLAVVPLTAEIGPSGVDGLDESKLLRASPAFEFLFTRNRFPHILMTLEPDQAVAVVTRGEPAMLFPFALENTLQEIARYSDVKVWLRLAMM